MCGLDRQWAASVVVQAEGAPFRAAFHTHNSIMQADEGCLCQVQGGAAAHPQAGQARPQAHTVSGYDL